jgi:hypothetical protein
MTAVHVLNGPNLDLQGAIAGLGLFGHAVAIDALSHLLPHRALIRETLLSFCP